MYAKPTVGEDTLRSIARAFLAGVVGLALFFFFKDPATTEIYTLSLHDALPISGVMGPAGAVARPGRHRAHPHHRHLDRPGPARARRARARSVRRRLARGQAVPRWRLARRNSRAHWVRLKRSVPAGRQG